MEQKDYIRKNQFMKYLQIVSIFFFFNLSLLKAEIVKQIKIQGNERISEETILIYGDINKGSDYQEKDLDLIIKKLYETEFFENVDVSLSSNILNINLIEYKTINQLEIFGENSNRLKKEIKKAIKLKDNRSYIKSYLANDIEKIKKLYSSLGYNSTKVEAKIRELDNNNVDLVLQIDKGNITKISSIKFIGDKKVRDKRLRDVIASEENKFWKFISRNTKFNEDLVKLDLRLLTNYYRSIGYYKVQVSSKTANLNEDGNIDIIYSIDAGKRFRIKKIQANPSPVFDKNIFFPLNDDFKKVIGEYYSPFKIKKLLENIDEIIDKNNLQFVEHNVEESVDTDGISIKFNIFEGERVLVERINIIGNNITDEAVIRGELLLDEGDPFTKLSLDKSVAKIKARNIFREVSSDISKGSKNNLKVLNINVEEKPTGEISAGAGIGTDGGTIAFNIAENNWLGEGKNVNFEVEYDSESLSGTINYTDPNYDFLGNSINYYVGSSSNDKPDQGYENTVITSGINTSFEQYKDTFASIGLNFAFDDLRTNDSASSSLKKQSGEFTELSADYGVRYDKRNRAFMPTSGSVISFNQSIPLYADRPFIGNSFALSSYREISEDIIGASKLFLTTINGLNDEDVRLSKRRNLSSKRLRGFKRNKVGPKDSNEHVGGNYAASLNLEANLPNFFPDSTRTDLGFFLDFGNVWGVDYDDNIDESNEIRSSTGAAINWSSPIGPMSFVLSTNLKKADTDETEGFKFNLGTTF